MFEGGGGGGWLALLFLVFVWMAVLLLSGISVHAATYDVSYENRFNKVFTVDPNDMFTYMNHGARPTITTDGGTWTRTYKDGSLVGANGDAMSIGKSYWFEDKTQPIYVEGLFQEGVRPWTIKAVWQNVGKYGGRWIRAELQLKNFLFKPNTSYPGGNPPYVFPTIEIYEDFWYGTWMFHIQELQAVYNFYYMDTGEKVDLTGSYVTYASLNVNEGAGINYNGSIKAYLSDGTYVTRRNNVFYGTSNDFTDYIGGETLYKAAVTFQIPTSTLDAQLYSDGWAWIKPDFCSLFSTLPVPIKTVDKRSATAGDTLTYTLEQGIHPVTIYKYSSLSFWDSLPDGTDYVSASVVYKNGSSNRTLSASEYTVTRTGQVVNIALKPSFVSSLSYTGDESVKAVIQVRLNDQSLSKSEISNQGYTLVNSSRVETNVVKTSIVKYSITTSKEGSGTITPSIPAVRAGGSAVISYTPSSGYYVKSVSVDGVAVNTATYPKSYTFSNIQANHRIHVVFEPCFRIDTSVVGGTITPTIVDGIPGTDREVSYAPSSGYMLESVTVDGGAVDIKTYPSKYVFRKLSKNHSIRVVYRRIPELVITKQRDVDSIRPDGLVNYIVTVSQKHGGTYASHVVVSDTIPTGLVLDSVKSASIARSGGGVTDVSDQVQVSGNSWRLQLSDLLVTDGAGKSDVLTIAFSCRAEGQTLGTVTNTAAAKADESGEVRSSVDVEIIGWKIETSIEGGGRIDPCMEGIRQGENRTIGYTPDNGNYVKSVLVDDVPLSGSDLKSVLEEYVFSNIGSDHRIHVVCAKKPVIELSKRVSGNPAHMEKGELVFPFVISGTDYLGDPYVFTRMLCPTLYEDDSVVLHLPAGLWRVKEVPSNWWRISNVEPGDFCEVDGVEAILDTRDSDHASVRFINKPLHYLGCTDSDGVVNVLSD